MPLGTCMDPRLNAMAYRECSKLRLGEGQPLAADNPKRMVNVPTGGAPTAEDGDS